MLEQGVRKLMDLHEHAQAVLKDEKPTYPLQNLPREDWKELAWPIHKSLQSVTAKEWVTPAKYREWWNNQEEKRTFLKNRTGKDR